MLWTPLGCSGLLWATFWAWACLGPSWTFGPVLCYFGLSWTYLGDLSHLGPVLGYVGPVLDNLGPIFRPSQSCHGPVFCHLDTCLARLGAILNPHDQEHENGSQKDQRLAGTNSCRGPVWRHFGFFFGTFWKSFFKDLFDNFWITFGSPLGSILASPNRP